MKYRKKRVVIDAIQATGTPESNREIIDWTRGSKTPAYMDKRPPVATLNDFSNPEPDRPCLSISTLEGTMWVDDGDWIIKGVQGEFYPCKPDIFEATYDAVTES